jgi:pseudouridine-5'-phosphate glycosidase
VSAELTLGEEVRAALAAHGAVVGLETSVVGQGLPAPRNLDCVERMSGAIRGAGAIPAWIGVVDGALTIGLTDRQLARFAVPGVAAKVARRDLPAAVARDGLGATTVSATIWAAAAAGIAICATGGIGGVHPGEHPDVSADLVELARTPGLLVCSGPKSIVDPVATAERLEELSILVIGYGVERLPYFLAREAPLELEHRVDDPFEAAGVLRVAAALGTPSTLLLCNPVPLDDAMDPAEVAAASREAEARADAAGAHGKARTPFLLDALALLTGGRSLEANLALLEDNARVAAEVAVAAAT